MTDFLGFDSGGLSWDLFLAAAVSVGDDFFSLFFLGLEETSIQGIFSVGGDVVPALI